MRWRTTSKFPVRSSSKQTNVDLELQSETKFSNFASNSTSYHHQVGLQRRPPDRQKMAEAERKKKKGSKETEDTEQRTPTTSRFAVRKFSLSKEPRTDSVPTMLLLSHGFVLRIIQQQPKTFLVFAGLLATQDHVLYTIASLYSISYIKVSH